MNRKEKNEMKKKRKERKREDEREKTTRKAERILGAGPIKKESIEHFKAKGMNIEEAKLAAVREWMNYFLRLSWDEIESINIGGTQIAAKDDYIYIAFEDLEDLKDIQSRVAACKNEDIVTRSYVPPQYYKRYMYLSAQCKFIREKDRNTKTQLRFKNKDIEVLTKDKGSNDPYKPI